MPRILSNKKRKVAQSARASIYTIYIGIDPGKSGGLVALDENGKVVQVTSMLETNREVLDWFMQFEGEQIVGYLERVGGYSSGVEGFFSPPSAFKFGAGYGALEMALTAARIRYENPMPQKWMKALGVPPRKKVNKKYVESKTEYKNRLKAIAQRLFPAIKVTLAIADALLIAYYGWKTERGLL